MNNQLYLKNVVSLEYNKDLCIGCSRCVEVCPHGVFRMDNKKASIVHKDRCMECGACQLNCVPNAIQVSSGVGCATAVINGILRNSEPSCDCGSDAGCC